MCIPLTPAELLSYWENPYLTNCIFFRHDLLQRILECRTLDIVFKVRLTIGQRNHITDRNNLPESPKVVVLVHFVRSLEWE